jgi:hypothetical protein
MRRGEPSALSGVAARVEETRRLVEAVARSAAEVSSSAGSALRQHHSGVANGGAASYARPPPPDAAAQAAFGARLAALALADAEEARGARETEHARAFAPGAPLR